MKRSQRLVRELQRNPGRLRDLGVDAVDTADGSPSGQRRRSGISLRNVVPVQTADELVAEMRRKPEVAEVTYSSR